MNNEISYLFLKRLKSEVNVTPPVALTSSNFFRIEREVGQIRAFERSGWPQQGASDQPRLVWLSSP